MIDVDCDKGKIFIFVFVSFIEILIYILKMVIDLIKERFKIEIFEIFVLLDFYNIWILIGVGG